MRSARSGARRRGAAAALSLLVLVTSAPAVSAATLFTDGFESGDLSAWSGSTRFSVQQSTVRTGSWAGRASSTGSSSHAWRNVTTTNEVWARTWFRIESRSTAVWLTGLRKSGGGAILLVGLDSGGKLIAKNVVTKKTYRSTTAVPSGSWHLLEVHAKTGGGGRFDVSLDGAAVAALSRSDNLGSTAVGRFAIGDPNSGRTYRVAFDDASIASDAGTTPPPPPSPPDDPATVGQWTEPLDIGVIGVHAVLLHTGKVLLFHRTLTATNPARLFDPVSGTLTDVNPPLDMEYDLFCSAHVTAPDGEVFVVGGTAWNGANGDGTEQTAFFDPATESWRVGPTMTALRWYPTVTTLANGDAMVVAGSVQLGNQVGEVERFDASSGDFSVLPSSATSTMKTYPRMFLLRDGRLVRVGIEIETRFLDPETATWTTGPSMSTARVRGSAVLLPGLDRILAVGGAKSQTGATLASTEILDLGAAQPEWQPSGSMHVPRRNVNVVLLPDGKVLAVGGNKGTEPFNDPVLSSELYDPATGSWSLMASQEAPRAYHSTAVLLPDGRVLSAGQNSGTMQTTMEIYSPPYLFAGPRPTISSAPTDVTYGATFEVATPDAGTVDGAVLIRPGTVTHGVNFDQRSVELSFAREASSVTVTGPSSGTEAPPGWYLLFLTREGVPSVASWVRVG